MSPDSTRRLTALCALLLLGFVPLAAQAQGLSDVRALRQAIAPVEAATPTAAEGLWNYFAFGAMRGHEAAGRTCSIPFSAGELAAHMRFTADPQARLTDTLAAFFAAHDCTAADGARGRGGLGFSDGWEAAANVTLVIRTSCDENELKGFVSRGESADALGRAAGVVAGARLLELKSQPCRQPGQQKPLP